METPHTILTFCQCPHFIIFGAELSCFEALDLFDALSEQAQDALSVIPLEHHKQSAIDANLSLRDLLMTTVKAYKQLGLSYHKLEFAQRAKTANDPQAALAHQQFAINCQDIGDDEWFAPMMTVAETMLDVEDLLTAPDSSSKISDAIAKINDGRFLYGSAVLNNMSDLRDSVSSIQAEKSYKRKGGELPPVDELELPSKAYIVNLNTLTQWVTRTHETLEGAD